MKILVTGNGLLASSIISQLVGKGHELLVYSRNTKSYISCQQVQGDIFDFSNFRAILDKWNPQIVISTAWLTTPGVYRDDISNFKYFEFTKKLADHIRNSSVEHLIVLGTCAEYGHQQSPSIAGITKLAPLSLYAEQKVAAFKSASDSLQDTQTRFTWARIFYPYGPNQDQRRLIPHIIKSLLNQTPMALDDITSVYDWISARDVASAISWIIEHDLPLEIDIGTTIGYTNLHLLKIAEDLIGRRNVINSDNQHRTGLSEVFVASKESSLFKSGWKPTDTLVSGLEWVLNS